MPPDVLRVLVVEDDPMISMAVEATVEDEGHCLVGAASSSRSAMGLANAESPDLVLLDFHLLDGPTGLDVARHVRLSGIEVLFTTANATCVAQFEDALGHLVKPFSQAVLERTLRYVAQCLKSPPPSNGLPSGFTFLAGDRLLGGA